MIQIENISKVFRTSEVETVALNHTLKCLYIRSFITSSSGPFFYKRRISEKEIRLCSF